MNKKLRAPLKSNPVTAIILITLVSSCSNLSTATELTWKTQFKSNQCPISESGVQIFNAKQGHAFLRNIEKESMRRVIGKTPKLFDLKDDQSVVAIAMGQKSSGGYGVNVKHIQATNTGLEIKVDWVTPSPDGFTTSALTSPCTIFAIDQHLPFEKNKQFTIKVFDANNAVVLEK